jgi:hypothetical protein
VTRRGTVQRSIDATLENVGMHRRKIVTSKV